MLRCQFRLKQQAVSSFQKLKAASWHLTYICREWSCGVFLAPLSIIKINTISFLYSL